MPAPGENPGRTAFISDLRTERQTFGAFHQILQTEQEILLHGEIDALVKLAQAKADKVVALTRLAENRNLHLRSLALNADRLGMSEWLVAYGGDEAEELAALWNEILELAHSAQQINETNGAMIETRLRHNQQALAALHAAASQGGFYGPDGQTHGFGLGRPLGKV